MPPSSKGRKPRPVVCLEKGEVFPTAKEAALFAGVGYASIRSAICQQCRAGGYHWHYQDSPAPEVSPTGSVKRSRRAVVCWETGEVFASASLAAESVGVSRSSINDAVRKRGKSGGYHWYFADQPRPESFGSREPARRASREAVCWETGEVFESAAAAGEAVGVKGGSISNAIKRGGTAGGFHWYWSDQPRPEAFETRSRPGGKGRPKRAVVCWETGEVFASAKEAAEAKGIKYSANICAAIKKKSAAGGFHWFYQSEPKPLESEFKMSVTSRQRPVLCVETGEVYPTIQEAARSANVRASSIWKSLESGCLAGGFHWKDANDEE